MMSFCENSNYCFDNALQQNLPSTYLKQVYTLKAAAFECSKH